MTHKGGAVQCTIYMSGSVRLSPHQDLARLELAMSDKKDVNGLHKVPGIFILALLWTHNSVSALHA